MICYFDPGMCCTYPFNKVNLLLQHGCFFLASKTVLTISSFFSDIYFLVYFICFSIFWGIYSPQKLPHGLFVQAHDPMF